MAEVRSGSFNTTGYSDSLSPDHYVFSWTLVSQSIVDNTTTIDWSVVAAGGSTAGYYNTVRERYVTVYGATKSASDAQTTYNGTTPFSGRTVIKHDSNGKGSFSASCGGAFEYSGSYNSTGSGSWDLPTIQRATKPVYSATTANLGGRITIALTPANSTFKHKIRYFWSDLKNQVDGLNIGADFTAQGNSTVTFDIPTSLGSKIPNTFSGICQVYCYTYTSTGTHIGTEITDITLNVPSYTPSITNVTLAGKDLLSGAYVQGKSSVTVNANVATQYGAGIKSITTTIDGVSYTELPVTSKALSTGSKTAKITFVDTRGKSATVESAAFQVYAYSAPNITEFTLARQSDGTTVIATVKGSISAVNNKNSKTVKVTLNGKTNTITSSTYTINATTTFTGVSTDQTLTGRAVFTDAYTSVERAATLPTVAVTMDFYKDGNGIAMGKVAEKGNLLDVAWDMKVGGNITDKFGALIHNGLAVYGGGGETGLDPNTTLEELILTSHPNAPQGIGTFFFVHTRFYNTKSTSAARAQLAYSYNKAGYLYHRYYASSGWSAWERFLRADELSNYVTEQGVSGEWNYTKWNNGKSEAWRSIELGDVPLTTQMIAGVYSNTSYNGRGVTLPSGLFADIPLAFANVYSNGYTHCQVASANTTQVVYRLWSPYSATVTGVIVSLYVVGKWK